MPLEEKDVQGQETGTDTITENTETSDSQGSDEEQLEATSDEQSQDDQDTEETKDEEDTEETDENGIKDPKSKNFDWKKISEKLGSKELEQTFRNSERKITQVSQENRSLKEQVQSFEQTVAPLQEKAKMFEWFDNLVQSNPALRAQIQAAVQGTQNGQTGAQNASFELPKGVHPDDPLAPLVVKQQQMLDQLLNQSRQAEQMQRQTQLENTFRQGLVDAKGSFKKLIGRDMSEKELRTVAEKMRSTGVLNGADWVPSLFVEEIRKSERNRFLATRKDKKNLPKSPNGVRQSKTSKPPSVRDAFDEAWEKEFGTN